MLRRVALLLALVLAGCGSSATHSAIVSPGPGPRAHPHAIEPAAGDPGTITAAAGPAGAPVGDPHAHAPSLAEVKRELTRLNLCGGTTDPADAAPLAGASRSGFVADPGTVQDVGELPIITARLNTLGEALHVTIYGISGYRSPQHSVAVGGYATDPHTQGEAEDIGVNSLLRSSAARISEATLAAYGLYRPFDPSDDPNNTEVNHVQLIPRGGPLSLAQSTATFDPDPTCS